MKWWEPLAAVGVVAWPYLLWLLLAVLMRAARRTRRRVELAGRRADRPRVGHADPSMN